MSVICGVYSLQTSRLEPISKEKLQETFKHISPSQIGYFKKKEILLANLLQYNTTESLKETLPFVHRSQKYTIVADCRIDNRLELIKLLKIKDTSIPDAQLILEVYLVYGESCIQHLIGAFAFAIWDASKKKLFCARDQMGVRPFFFYKDNNYFAFSSEKKGILMHPNLDSSINHDYVLSLLTFQDIPPTTTFYKNIIRLLPAHSLTVQNGDMQIKKYWDLDAHKKTYFKDKREYIFAFREYMTQAITCRTRSNREVGAELSGGLDSSGISALANQILLGQGKELHTFTLSLAKEYRNNYIFKDDYDLVTEVCKKAKIKHSYHFSKLAENNFLEELDFMLKVYDGIEANPNSGAQFIMAKAKAVNVGTILSGFPGDELVTSYCKNSYLAYLEQSEFRNFLRFGINHHGYKKILLHAIYFYLHRLNAPLANLIAKSIMADEIKGKLKNKITIGTFLKEEFLKKNPHIIKEQYKKNKILPASSFRESQKRHVLRPHTSLRMENRNLGSNYSGIEVRYPMADIRLLQYMLSVPIEQKINSSFSRLLFRRGMDNVLPKSVAWRPESEEAFAINPNNQLNFEKNYQHRISFLESLKDVKNLEFLAVDKIIQQHEQRLNKFTKGKNTYSAGNRHPLVLALALYAMKNPKFQLKF